MSRFGLKNPEVIVPMLISAPGALAALIKHTFADWTSEKFFEARRNGKPIGFTETVEEIILDELTILDDCPGKDILNDAFTIAKKSLSNSYRMFVCDDLLGVALGSPRLLTADYCKVGVPYNVSYRSVDDVAADYDRLKISAATQPGSWLPRFLVGRSPRSTKIEWGSELGVKLMESLVLTTLEKKFLIQRLLQEADAMNTMAFEAISFLVPLASAGIANGVLRKYMEIKYRLARRPTLWPIYLLTTVAGVFVSTVAQRSLRTKIDTKADRLTADIDEMYARAGVAYYEKLMERNRCVNGLLERANLRPLYAPDGDYPTSSPFRRPMTSLKLRIQEIRGMAKEQESSTNI